MVIGYVLSVWVIVLFYLYFVCQWYFVQVDLVVVCDDVVVLVVVVGGEGVKWYWFVVMGQCYQDFYFYLGVKVGVDNCFMGGYYVDYCIVKVDIVCQGVGIQCDLVFMIFSGIRQDGIFVLVGVYFGLVFYFYVVGVGGFYQYYGIV